MYIPYWYSHIGVRSAVFLVDPVTCSPTFTFGSAPPRVRQTVARNSSVLLWGLVRTRTLSTPRNHGNTPQIQSGATNSATHTYRSPYYHTIMCLAHVSFRFGTLLAIPHLSCTHPLATTRYEHLWIYSTQSSAVIEPSVKLLPPCVLLSFPFSFHFRFGFFISPGLGQGLC